MDEIRQKGKVILHSDDGISIPVIFNNLTGRNFKGEKYATYIRHTAPDMGFRTGEIEHCRDGEVINKGTIPTL